MKNLVEFKAKVESEIEKLKNEEIENAPTGRCKITTAFGTTCHNGLTLNSCNRAATNVGGVASWTEGATCP